MNTKGTNHIPSYPRPDSLGAVFRLVAFLALVVLLNGCQGNEDPIDPKTEETEEAISFSNELIEDQTVTRAAQGLEEVLTNKTFVVYGYKNDNYEADSYTSFQTVMNAYTVNWKSNSANSTVSNTDGWEYVGQGTNQSIKYWDWSALAYRFFAYAQGNATADPATEPETVTVSAPSGTPQTVTFSTRVDVSSEATMAAAPYFSKLWFSTGNVVEYPNCQFGRPVRLHFVKPFARVRFIFTFADGLSFGRESLQKPEFKPTDGGEKIATAGTVAVTYPLTGTATEESWTTTATSSIDMFDIDYYEADDAYTPANAQETTYDNTPQKWYTVLPQTHGSFTVSVRVVTTDTKTAIVPAEFMDWKAGYEYTYKFKITEGGGLTLDVIQIGINQWGIEHDIEHNVFNW